MTKGIIRKLEPLGKAYNLGFKYGKQQGRSDAIKEVLEIINKFNFDKRWFDVNNQKLIKELKSKIQAITNLSQETKKRQESLMSDSKFGYKTEPKNKLLTRAEGTIDTSADTSKFKQERSRR